MNISFKANSWLDVLLHLIIMLMLSAIAVLSFFYIWLPKTTHHGQTITVPNITGMKLNELKDFLESKGLQYHVDDSTYNPDMPPLSVYAQFPLPNAKVKENRKIYISVYSQKPPLVRMPSLLNRTLLNAQTELESYGLRIGERKYVPDIQLNTVIKQLYNNQEIVEGTLIPKNAQIDLVIGDGLGNQEFEVPDLTNKPLDEAEDLAKGSNLQIGSRLYDPKSNKPAGTITKQKPLPGEKILVGEIIDIWISGQDPASIETIELPTDTL